MAMAALALHQLRYLLAPAHGLERVAHGYMPVAATVVASLFALAVGQFAMRVARARDDGTGEAQPGAFGWAWLTATAGLVAIFATQELLESVLAGGHAVDPLAGGGLWALPLALALGAFVALALRLAGVAVRAAIRRARRPARRPGPVVRPVWRPLRLVGSLLARHLAGRAPPLTS